MTWINVWSNKIFNASMNHFERDGFERGDLTKIQMTWIKLRPLIIGGTGLMAQLYPVVVASKEAWWKKCASLDANRSILLINSRCWCNNNFSLLITIIIHHSINNNIHQSSATEFLWSYASVSKTSSVDLSSCLVMSRCGKQVGRRLR